MSFRSLVIIEREWCCVLLRSMNAFFKSALLFLVVPELACAAILAALEGHVLTDLLRRWRPAVAAHSMCTVTHARLRIMSEASSLAGPALANS